MAYSGGIEFVKIPYGRLSWIKHNYLKLKDRDGAVTVSLGEIPKCTKRSCENCTTGLCERRHVLVDAAGMKRGWIQYDVESDEESNTIQCVVIGRQRAEDTGPDQYYILLVSPTSVDGQYKRVGVGQVESGCAVRQEGSILLV
jgi:hypothetical protein